MRTQQLLVFVGVLIYAILAAAKVRTSFPVMMVCILAVGNALAPLQTAGERLYAHRRFPWNWVVYLALLTGSALLGALAAAGLLVWILPSPDSYRSLVRETAPLSMVITFVAGSVGYIVRQIQRKFEEKNRQLEQAVERGTLALRQQEQELQRAGEIQQNLLPKTLPQLAGVQLAGAWQPARTVGGDYFDVLKLDTHRLGICIADVAGKGMAAALLMANLQAAFRAFATADATPATVCSKLNAFLCANIGAGKFITFFYAVLDTEHRLLTYENAGHCPALVLRQSGKPEALSGQGAVLGVFPDWHYADCVAQLQSGDRLLLFTDGVVEAVNDHEREFGEARLISAAGKNHETALVTQRRIMEDVTAFCQDNFQDDATVLVATIG